MHIFSVHAYGQFPTRFADIAHYLKWIYPHNNGLVPLWSLVTALWMRQAEPLNSRIPLPSSMYA